MCIGTYPPERYRRCVRRHNAVLHYMAARRVISNTTLRLHQRELLVGDRDHVASLTNGPAVLGGMDHTWSTIGLYRFREGLIAECRLLPLDGKPLIKSGTATPRSLTAWRPRGRTSAVSHVNCRYAAGLDHPRTYRDPRPAGWRSPTPVCSRRAAVATKRSAEDEMTKATHPVRTIELTSG